MHLISLFLCLSLLVYTIIISIIKTKDYKQILKVVDLSVPVTALNQKSDFQDKQPEKKQRTLRPKTTKVIVKKVEDNPEK